MNRIVTAQDVAKRDNFTSVREWIRVTSMQLKMKGGCPVAFSGNMSGGKVYAYISNGRWLAICNEAGCSGCEYVDPQEKIFFCMVCGNGGTGKGKQVVFPRERVEIENALLERVMVHNGGNDIVTQAFNARPLEAGLRRDWLPSQLKEAYEHPALFRRVLVDSFGDGPQVIHSKTMQIRQSRGKETANAGKL